MHIESRNKTENGEETYIKTIKVVSKFGRASVKQTTSDESLSNDGDGFIGLLPKKKRKNIFKSPGIKETYLFLSLSYLHLQMNRPFCEGRWTAAAAAAAGRL